MDISIVILNYKQKGLVKQCIKGILSSQPKLEYEIIVVDNNSGDGCLAAVTALFAPNQPENLFSALERAKPKLVTIQAPGNDGFAVGNNLGIAQARGRYVMILNPDIAIVPGALEKMFAFMETHPDAGIIGPKLINPDGSVQFSCRRFPNWRMPLYRRTFFGKLRHGKKALTNYLMTDFNHDTTITIDWLFGACLLVRASMFRKIGFFDERFFMYFEDLDLCRRCWEAGFAVYYFTDVELVHYHQRLSAEKSGIWGIFNRAGRVHLWSGLKYFAKYFGAKYPNRPSQAA